MCGRYGRRADKQRIAEWVQRHNTNVFDDSYFAPSYNVAPQSLQAVVRLDSETGQRELTLMRWGLVPFWAKDTKIGYSTIDVKSETVTTSPALREPNETPALPYPRGMVFTSGRKSMPKRNSPMLSVCATVRYSLSQVFWETWKDQSEGPDIGDVHRINNGPE